MNYRFLAPALVGIREATTFYEGRVSGLRIDFLNEVDAAIERILSFPEAWASIGGNYRRCHLRRFPFSVVYSIQSGDEILVIPVFDQSRKPRS